MRSILSLRNFPSLPGSRLRFFIAIHFFLCVYLALFLAKSADLCNTVRLCDTVRQISRESVEFTGVGYSSVQNPGAERQSS